MIKLALAKVCICNPVCLSGSEAASIGGDKSNQSQPTRLQYSLLMLCFILFKQLHVSTVAVKCFIHSLLLGIFFLILIVVLYGYITQCTCPNAYTTLASSRHMAFR